MGWHGAYKPRKPEVGEQLFALRTRAQLTQVELAALVGVSHRSVQGWEAGAAYPQEDKLRQLISVFLTKDALTPGEEYDEAYDLWQLVSQDARRPLPPFDEEWFAALLADFLQDDKQGTALEQQISPIDNPTPLPTSQRVASLIDWGEAPDIAMLHGREAELATLQQWVIEDHCREVTLLGLGGIGKTSLALTFANQVAAHFDGVFFRSLRNTPPLTFILNSLIDAASAEHFTLPESVADKIALLIQLLRERRYLIVLDNLETILQPGAYAGTYRADYEEYGLLLQRLGEITHRSCLLLTSREKPAELGPLEGRTAPVRTLVLTGLANDACRAILEEKELFGTGAEVEVLANLYGGNPLALKLISEPIHEVFSGNLNLFLSTGDAFFNGVGKLLDQQFHRSASTEQALLYWLAIERDFVTLGALQANFAGGVLPRDILIALESLRRRLLVERRTHPSAFTLQPVIMEYVTDRLVEHLHHEIVDGQPHLLRSHALVQATAKDYVRRSQEQLIATPLLERLMTTLGGAAAVEQLLVERLQQWRGQPVVAQGYGPGNVVNLLRLLRGDLRSLDLAGLAIRQAYLQGLDLQDSSLAHVVIHDSVFSETFDDILAVTISSDGAHWAASSRRGEIRVWEAGAPNGGAAAQHGATLRHVWRAHTDMIWALAFSPDGRMLVSGSWDGTIKLWDVASGAPCWSGRHASHLHLLAFAPDGRTLASSGPDATVRLWDVQHGTQMETLPHPDSVLAVTWSPDGRLLASGEANGSIRVWELRQDEPASCVRVIAAHTTLVDGLAFARDGRTLASASWDGTVKLWEVAGGRLKQTLSGHTDWARRVVWSPDGSMLASCGFDQTVWLWDVEQESYRAPLRGHTAAMTSIAFTPDSRTLLSSSEDGTVRVWDVATRQCLRVMQGHVASLYNLAWSPDGTQLVSGGTDRLVTIHTATGGARPRVLDGDNSITFGLGWSPDGRTLASSEWNNIIRLWDLASGTCTEVLHHPEDSGNYFHGVAWSPDGQRLACGTNRHGVLVWDMIARRPQWTTHDFPTWIRPVAWSPDSSQVAGGGDDGAVYVWDAVEGTLMARLAGHQEMISSVAWSPNGTRLASGGRAGTSGELFVWDVEHGERVRPFAQQPGMVCAVAWGPNEDVVISGGANGNLRWWDVRRDICVQVRQAHQGTVQALRRSPDGTKLASCGDDGAIMLWDLRSGDYLQTLRRDRPYERMNITGLMGITEAQRASLLALGAVERSE